MGSRLDAARAASNRKNPCSTCDFIRSLSKADRADWDAAVADPSVSMPGLLDAFADLNPPGREAVRTHNKRGHRVQA